ncbi:MAG: hypothetical protein ACYC2R_13240, partial [Burkholderiales bacterium]
MLSMFQPSLAPKDGRYPGTARLHCPQEAVSILARPEGRALRNEVRASMIVKKFLSSPAPKDGRDFVK